MHPTPPDPPQVPTRRKFWNVYRIAAFVASVFGIITGVFWFFEETYELCCSSPPALVKVTTISDDTGPICLKFAFEQLPSDFTLGRIQFKVIAASELSYLHFAGAHPIWQKWTDRDMAVSDEVMEGKVDKIFHEVNIQADKNDDAAIVVVCPVSSDPGMSAELTVVPSFLSVTDVLIENIKIKTGGESSDEDGIKLTVRAFPSYQNNFDQTE